MNFSVINSLKGKIISEQIIYNKLISPSFKFIDQKDSVDFFRLFSSRTEELNKKFPWRKLIENKEKEEKKVDPFGIFSGSPEHFEARKQIISERESNKKQEIDKEKNKVEERQKERAKIISHNEDNNKSRNNHKNNIKSSNIYQEKTEKDNFFDNQKGRHKRNRGTNAPDEIYQPKIELSKEQKEKIKIIQDRQEKYKPISKRIIESDNFIPSNIPVDRRAAKDLTEAEQNRKVFWDKSFRVWMDWDKGIIQDDIRLVYGDWGDSFVVIEKPSGIPIMDSDPDTDTVESRIKKILGININIMFPHRIDKWVNGLLVVAFDPEISSLLNQSLYNLHWHKRYRVLTQIPRCVIVAKNEGIELPKCDTINSSQGSIINQEFEFKRKGLFISNLAQQTRENNPRPEEEENDHKVHRHSNDEKCDYCDRIWRYKAHHPFVIRHLLYRSVEPPEGKKSITQFIHQKTDWDCGVALFDAVLKTGRTHQIRIHFSDAGLPIIGDPYYNPHTIEFLRRQDINPRSATPKDAYEAIDATPPRAMGLQAYKLEFPHPTNKGELIKLELPWPKRWENFSNLLKEKNQNILIRDSELQRDRRSNSFIL